MAQAPTQANTRPVERTVRQETREEAPRARPVTFGGPRLKLAVNASIPGYHMIWENDTDDGNIEQLLVEGFEFVTKSEVTLTQGIVADEDLSSRVSRYVGSKEDGSPLRAYLLKIPEEVWQERESYRYNEADLRDDNIRRGIVGSGSAADHDGMRRLKKAPISMRTNAPIDLLPED